MGACSDDFQRVSANYSAVIMDVMKAKNAKMIERLYPGLLSGILRPQKDGMKTYLGFSGINWAP